MIACVPLCGNGKWAALLFSWLGLISSFSFGNFLLQVIILSHSHSKKIFNADNFICAGIYVLMFVNITYTFGKTILLTTLLVIAFALAFFMAFFDPSPNFAVSFSHSVNLLFFLNNG